jgi:cyclopropane fatty-acyl-phospholipid synthase-like methyltransferase
LNRPADQNWYPDPKLTKALRAIVKCCPEGARVLDLGCGNGRLLMALRDEKGCDVRGIEFSEAGAKLCVEKGLDVRHANVDDHLRNDDLRAFIFDSYDVVCSTKAFQYFETKNQIMRDLPAPIFFFQHNNNLYWKHARKWMTQGPAFARDIASGEFRTADGEAVLCTPSGFANWARSYGFESKVIYGGHILAGAVVMRFTRNAEPDL